MNNDTNCDLSIVRRAPVFWKYLPYFCKVRGLLFINRIYLRADVFDDVYSSSPDPYSISILIHEQTHYQRMKEIGMLRFGIKYIFSAKGRFEEELAAITEQMRYLKEHGKNYNIERTARALSSWYYLWCSDYKVAYKELENRWNSLN